MTSSKKQSPAVVQDVNQLLLAAFRTAMGIVDREAASRPFAVLLDLQGVITVRGVQDPGADDHALTQSLTSSILSDSASLLAVLLVENIGDEVVPTMRGYGDHRLGAGFNFFLDWVPRAAGGPRPAQFQSTPSQGSFFR